MARPPLFGGISRLLSSAAEVAVFPGGDLRAAYDPRQSLPPIAAALATVSIPIILATAAPEVSVGYGYRDVITLCIGLVLAVLATLAIRWTRFDDRWLFGIIGFAVVFIASLATLTGGGRSAYFVLYAPLLALAGWYLRRPLVVLSIGLVAGTEIWRAVVIEGQAQVQQLTIALPFFGLVALVSMFTSARLLGALSAIRQTQLQTASALQGVRQIGAGSGSSDPLGDLAAVCAEVFGANAGLIRLPDTDVDTEAIASEPIGASRGYLRAAVSGTSGSHALLQLWRDRPFTTTEARLVGLLAEVAARAVENDRLVARIRTESEHDSLTNLWNRRVFDRDLANALDQTADDRPAVSVAFVDLDHFKTVNDRFGHERGDQVLRQVAAALLIAVRREDRVYRLGGDEFAVIALSLPEPTGAELGERLRSSLRLPDRRRFDARRPPLTLSIGVAAAGPTTSPEAIRQAADAAMYEAKAAGGNAVGVAQMAEPRRRPTGPKA